MSEREIPKRWRAILKPWHMHLDQMEDIILAPLSRDEYEWVHVDLGVASTKRNWRENVRRCREALELLAIIVAAESASDGELPQELCGSSLPAAPDRALPRCFLLNYLNEDCVKNVDDVEVYEEFFFAFDEHSLRDEFRQALDTIHSQLTPSMKETVEKHWRLPVAFFLVGDAIGSDLSVKYLKSAMALVSAVVERTNQESAVSPATPRHEHNNKWRYRFPYTDPQTRVYFSTRTLEHEAAPLLAELIAQGCRPADVDIDVSSCGALSRLPMIELGPILQAITDGASVRASEGYEKIQGGEWQELSFRNWWPKGAWHARMLQAVCSSLAVCKEFKELTEDATVAGVRSFSKDSAHSFTNLTISSADLQGDDVAAILDVLTAKHPGSKLLNGDNFQDGDDSFQEEDGDFGGDRPALNGNGVDTVERDLDDVDGTDPGFAYLKAGTTITIKPIDDDTQLGADPESFVLKQDGIYRVMRNDKRFEWVDIVVPHYGYCIVPRASVDCFAPPASTESPSTGCSVKITSLTVRDSNHEVLLPLIDFLGPKLVSVEIGVNYGDIITTDFVRRLLAACPNLKELQLGCGRLDRAVISSIFAFAAEILTRDIRVNTVYVH